MASSTSMVTDSFCVSWAKCLGVVLSTLVFLVVVGFLKRNLASCKPDDTLVHYNEDWAFTPIPGCRLAPPKPRWLESIVSACKAFMVGLAFGASRLDRWDTKTHAWSWCLLWSLTTFQVIMLALSLTFHLGNFLERQGPFQSRWDQYQCLGLVLTFGPWLLACLELPAQLWLTAHLLRLTRHWASGNVQNRVERWRNGKAFLTQKKLCCCKMVTLFTWSLFFPLYLPFIFTHVIPGACVFLPQVLLILAIGYCTSVLMRIFPLQRRILHTGICGEEESVRLVGARTELREAQAKIAKHAKEIDNAYTHLAKDVDAHMPELVEWHEKNMQSVKAKAEKYLAVARKQEETAQKEIDRIIRRIDEWASSFRFALLQTVPIILAVRISLETCLLQMVYLTSSVGSIEQMNPVRLINDEGSAWHEPIRIAWCERRWDLFIGHDMLHLFERVLDTLTF